MAVARHRAAVARRLGISETEMVAVGHLAQHGELTQTRLGELLDLSSGGTAALVQRMEREGHLLRREDPGDKRVRLIRISPETIERAASAYAPLVADLERLLEELGDNEALVTRFLSSLVEVSETHADHAWDGVRAPPLPHHSRLEAIPSLWG
jgi:MarR family transcriptional regulator, organic hydroperoxide resistance regulator